MKQAIILCAGILILASVITAQESAKPAESSSKPPENKENTGTALDKGKEMAPAPREIQKPDYPEAKAPDESPIFCWDFPQSKVLSYTYEKNTNNNTIIGLNSEKPNKSNSSNALYGLLLIKSTGDNMADMVMTDLKMSLPTVFYDNGKTENKEITVPPIAFHGMKEDGAVNLGRQDQTLKFLFPLPNKSLKKGESVKMPNQYPFSTMLYQLDLTGYSVITLTRYVTIGKRICAEFDVLTDISEYKMPPQLEGSLECYLRGKSRPILTSKNIALLAVLTLSSYVRNMMARRQKICPIYLICRVISPKVCRRLS